MCFSALNNNREDIDDYHFDDEDVIPWPFHPSVNDKLLACGRCYYPIVRLQSMLRVLTNSRGEYIEVVVPLTALVS